MKNALDWFCIYLEVAFTSEVGMSSLSQATLPDMRGVKITDSCWLSLVCHNLMHEKRGSGLPSIMGISFVEYLVHNN